jgi:hypothetical protein
MIRGKQKYPSTQQDKMHNVYLQSNQYVRQVECLVLVTQINGTVTTQENYSTISK